MRFVESREDLDEWRQAVLTDTEGEKYRVRFLLVAISSLTLSSDDWTVSGFDLSVELADKLGIPTSTFYDDLKAAKATGWLEMTEERFKGRADFSTYRLAFKD